MSDVEEPSELEQLRAKVVELERTKNQLHLLLRTRTAETDDTLERLRAILDTISDALLVTDRDQRIRLTNPAAADLLGLDPLAAGSLVTEHVDQPLSDLILTGASHGGEVTGEVGLTEGRIGKAVVNAIRSDTGEPAGAVTVIHDVTWERELDRMKSEFITNVSHELRTPLTSITGFARLVGKRAAILLPKIPDPDPKTRKHMHQIGENVEIIVRESKRLTARINEVIDFASLEAGKIAWKLEGSSLNDLVEIAVDQCSALFEGELDLVLELAEAMPLIPLDRQRIIQTVVNLLANAAKFTPHGQVSCITRATQSAVAVTVQDDGPGIDAAHLDAIFDRFSQVGGALSSKPGGTGLGLPFCRGVVEHHGGTIWADSTPGRGTAVTFRIPR